MMTREMWDALDTGLAGLRPHDAGAERVERIRTRCVAVVEARRRRGRARSGRVTAWGQRLEQAAAIALSALYVTAAIGSSVALLR